MMHHTYVFSHRGPIQAGAEKLGICGNVKGRLGTFGRGTLARLLVRDLPGPSPSPRPRPGCVKRKNDKSMKDKTNHERDEKSESNHY